MPWCRKDHQLSTQGERLIGGREHRCSVEETSEAHVECSSNGRQASSVGGSDRERSFFFSGMVVDD
jgi:hypothetical protein